MKLKLAVIVTAVFPTKVHGTVPEQPPLVHPPNVEPAAGVAARVTELPEANVAEQKVPQLMPVGVLATVPVPLPVLLTVTVILVVVEAGAAQASGQ